MLGLGASINIMPYLIYASLNLGPLEETGVIIQLADRSNTYPMWVVEDVFVMENNTSPNATPILLGRPFLKTAITKIDVHDGSLTMEFDREKICFNIFEAMRYPSDVHYVFRIDVIDELCQHILNLHGEDEIEMVISEAITSKQVEETLREDIIEVVSVLDIIHPTGNMEVYYIDLPLTNEKCYLQCKRPPLLS